MPDHSVEEAAALHLQAYQVRRSWHLRYSEAPDSLDRVHLVWKGVGKMGEIVPANKELSSIPAYSHVSTGIWIRGSKVRILSSQVPTQSTKFRAFLQAPTCRYVAALGLLCDLDHIDDNRQKGLSVCHAKWHATAAAAACNLQHAASAPRGLHVNIDNQADGSL